MGQYNRRDFLQAGGAASLGLVWPALNSANAASSSRSDLNLILLFLVGGPSQIDTWDPKLDAPSDIRGPFNPIQTNVPGILLSELFPLMSRQADKFSLMRTLHHSAPAVHETGQQLMQTGRLCGEDMELPHIGCVLDFLQGGRNGLPGHVLLPKPIGHTGSSLSHGQTAGWLGSKFEPCLALNRSNSRLQHIIDLRHDSEATREQYGRTAFGENCLRARKLVEAGVRCVTVNMYETVYDSLSWDAHGAKPFSTLGEMARLVAPTFDRAYSALLSDLHQRGLLSNTIVLATGEFGRTPRINPFGGRDHHTGVWTTLIGGGPIQGGRIVGESDRIGYAPENRPVAPAEVIATIYKAMGVSEAKIPGPKGEAMTLCEEGFGAIEELF